jgi:RecB family endonuclease NucS
MAGSLPVGIGAPPVDLKGKRVMTVIAQVIKPQAKVLAEARGITCVEVDYDELRGIESDVLKLF